MFAGLSQAHRSSISLVESGKKGEISPPKVSQNHSPVRQSVGIFRRANVSVEAFQDHLLAARQKTQERSAAIRKANAAGEKVKTPYMFALLEESLGLRASSCRAPA